MKKSIDQISMALVYEVIQAAVIAVLFFGPLFYYIWKHA
jgi:hypothetical protein